MQCTSEILPSGLRTTDRLVAFTNKLSSLIKTSKWHAHVVHMAEHMNMVGGPGPPKSGAALITNITRKSLKKIKHWIFVLLFWNNYWSGPSLFFAARE